MEVICDHAKIRCGECIHNSPHEEQTHGLCSPDTCGYTGVVVKCIPVATKKDQDDLLVRLKDQITWPGYDTRTNQLLIMEALVALLEGR
ncbi:MAG: hypothetical protein A2Y38_03345 [Spirochaetes bacterium GWB1_59_5]|nr:MAG: hypothetical protein A2Y38_03345 [Spirochaetes bacterium GWB1_59_5]